MVLNRPNLHPLGTLSGPQLMPTVSLVTAPVKESETDHGLFRCRKYTLFLAVAAILVVAVGASLLFSFFLHKPIEHGTTAAITSTRNYDVKNDQSCSLPRNQSCTASTPLETIAEGLGVFFQYPCDGVGCNFQRPFCRLCAKHPSKINAPYLECPKCVPDLDLS